MDLGIQSKTAIVTGGSRGIGGVETGARVAICARNKAAVCPG